MLELGRWKIRYQSGENNSSPDDYYWNSIVRFGGKQIDFCTPQGWGGAGRCDDKDRRGQFDHAYVVSDSPPALLLAYGGELWLFVERNKKIERQRVAVRHSSGVRDQYDEAIKRDAWDLRQHATIILDDDNWLETAPLRHQELSKPFSCFMRMASRSPDGRQVARICNSDLFEDGKNQLLIVVTDLSDPHKPKVSVLEASKTDGSEFWDQPAEKFDQFFAWGTRSGESIHALQPKKMRIRSIDAVLEHSTLKTTSLEDHDSDKTYSIPGATAVQLPALCETVFAAVQQGHRVTNLSSNKKSLELGDWGTISLKATDRGVQIEDPDSNHSAVADQTTFYINKILLKAFVRGELSLADSPNALKIRRECQ